MYQFFIDSRARFSQGLSMLTLQYLKLIWKPLVLPCGGLESNCLNTRFFTRMFCPSVNFVVASILRFLSIVMPDNCAFSVESEILFGGAGRLCLKMAIALVSLNVLRNTSLLA